jgi:hypothetical protein
MEDKEWSQRVLHQGYDIEFVPAIFCYDIKRTDEQLFFRYKNEVIGSYQLWHTDYKITTALKMVAGSTINACRVFSSSMYYTFKRFYFLVKFIYNKPEKF